MQTFKTNFCNKCGAIGYITNKGGEKCTCGGMFVVHSIQYDEKASDADEKIRSVFYGK